MAGFADGDVPDATRINSSTPWEVIKYTKLGSDVGSIMWGVDYNEVDIPAGSDYRYLKLTGTLLTSGMGAGQLELRINDNTSNSVYGLLHERNDTIDFNQTNTAPRILRLGSYLTFDLFMNKNPKIGAGSTIFVIMHGTAANAWDGAPEVNRTAISYFGDTLGVGSIYMRMAPGQIQSGTEIFLMGLK